MLGLFVQVMEGVKEISYQQLVMECVEQLGRMFKVCIPPHF